MPVMTPEELLSFLQREFPQSQPERIQIEEQKARSLRLRYRTGAENLRPGGTVSGPTLMAVSDLAMYLLILSALGPVPLAVTTNLNINFLRKPVPADLIAEARLLKLGKRLAVGDVLLYSEGQQEPVAHATLTYSIPDR